MLHVIINTAMKVLVLYSLFTPSSQYGHTALMWATLFGHSETVSVLVQLGVDLNVQDKVCVKMCTALKPIITTFCQYMGYEK